MHNSIDPSQCLRRLLESDGVELRAVATDEHHRCIKLEAALGCTRESRAKIAFPLGADLNAAWDRYAVPSRIADRGRYPQFHWANVRPNRTPKRCFEHTPCKPGRALGTQGWNEARFDQPRLRRLRKDDDPGTTHLYRFTSTLAGTPRQYAQRNRHIKPIVRHTPRLSQRRPEVTARARTQAGSDRARSRLQSSTSSING